VTAAVELLFDERLENRVRALWRRLAAVGISTPDQWPGPKRRPHISLAVSDALEPSHGEELATLAAPAAGVRIRMESVGWFSGGVLYLAPAWSAELTTVQAALWDRMGSWSVGPWPEYEPGRWVAHCTLATRLDPTLLGPALTTVTEFSPLEGVVRGLGLGVDGALTWEKDFREGPAGPV
jgi:hypothetical protein